MKELQKNSIDWGPTLKLNINLILNEIWLVLTARDKINKGAIVEDNILYIPSLIEDQAILS